MTGTELAAAAWAALVVAVRRRQRRPPPARLRGLPRRRPPPQPIPGKAVLIAATALLLWQAPPLGLAVAIAAAVRPRTQRARRARQAQAAVEADLPEAVDLLRMCVGAGLTVPLAIAAVSRRADGPVARALGQAAGNAAARGTRLADELDGLAQPHNLGEPVRGLTSVLVGSDRYGHAIGPALERLAAECRADERRRAEARARRVPVLLLFPLVTCILPAFALLTVAPLVAGAFRALRL